MSLIQCLTNEKESMKWINYCFSLTVIIVAAKLLVSILLCTTHFNHFDYNYNDTFITKSIIMDENLAIALSLRNTSFDTILGPIHWNNLSPKIQQSFFDSSGPNCTKPHFRGWTLDNRKASANMKNIAQSFRKYVGFINGTTYWYAEGIEINIQSVLKGLEIGATEYPNSSAQHYRALKYYPIKDQNVLVAGSVSPWLETILLSYKAKAVTTIDYNLPKYDGNNIKFKYVLDMLDTNNILTNDQKFDSIFSFSSIEHDGLGRYGDPINFNGDFAAMYEFKYLLKPNGTLYLGIPTGDQDYLYYNSHRIYGPCRLKTLFQGWKLIDVFGLNSDDRNDFNYFVGRNWRNQPLFVLKPLH
eukprot:286787_1